MSIPFPFRPTPSPTRNNDWLPPLSAPSLSLRTLDRTAQIGQSTFNDLQISRPLQPRIFSPYEFESITANDPSLDDPIEDDFAGFCNDPATIALLRQFDDVIGSKFSPYDNRPTYSASEKFFSQSMKQLQITHRIDGLSIHTLEEQTKGTTQALGAYNARAYQFLNVSYQSEVGPREALIVDLSKFNPFQAAPPEPTNFMNKYLVIEMTKLMPIVPRRQSSFSSMKQQENSIPKYMPTFTKTMLPLSPEQAFSQHLSVEYLNQGLNLVGKKRQFDPINPLPLDKSVCKIGGINGMATSFEQSMSHASYLTQFMPENNVEWVHNRSKGVIPDLFTIFFVNYPGHSGENAEMLQRNWIKFHNDNKDNPDAKYLQFCHSQGAIHVRNALAGVPKEIRDRLFVVAIAPAAIIDRSSCFRAFNYGSKRDIVPYGELYYAATLDPEDPEKKFKLVEAAAELKKQLIILKPHPNATGIIDHDFQSPTFLKVINEHIDDYLLSKGIYK
jgi:hypothetical protein